MCCSHEQKQALKEQSRQILDFISGSMYLTNTFCRTADGFSMFFFVCFCEITCIYFETASVVMPPVSARAFSANREELWKAASCHIKSFPKDAGVDTSSQISLYSFHQFSETVSNVLALSAF
jgi:hypothetical protein